MEREMIEKDQIALTHVARTHALPSCNAAPAPSAPPCCAGGGGRLESRGGLSAPGARRYSRCYERWSGRVPMVSGQRHEWPALTS
uniref:Uncharacterized protein n=1 Tax=Oryza sativa subsp. japonica TaxID=39947 RepID=Q8H397_ORYSJ|nr:hypothetical protein [Oryza sativa Japonica Group]